MQKQKICFITYSERFLFADLYWKLILKIFLYTGVKREQEITEKRFISFIIIHIPQLQPASLTQSVVGLYTDTYVLKQPLRVVPRKRCFENMQQTYRRTPMPNCDFHKVALELYWNHTSTWMFSSKFAA